jgi:hypothetical protein
LEVISAMQDTSLARDVHQEVALELSWGMIIRRWYCACVMGGWGVTKAACKGDACLESKHRAGVGQVQGKWCSSKHVVHIQVVRA